MTLPPPLVGRDEDVSVLVKLLDALAVGVGQAMIVEGEPGAGKTRLVGVAGALASSRAIRVLWGAGDEQLGVRPFAILAEALQDPAMSNRMGGSGRLVGDGASTGDAMFRATEAFVDRVEEFASSQPTLLVIDDLHLVDGPSLSVLAALGRRLRYLAVGLIGVARPPPRPVAVDRLVAAIESSGGWLHRLAPLGSAEQERLVALVTGGTPGPGLQKQAAATGGNPLYLVELMRALDAEGRLARSDGTVDTDADQLPMTFRQTVLRRLGHRSVGAMTVLQAAAVLGPRFVADDVSTLLELPPSHVAAVITEVCQPGLLSESMGGYEFSHTLVRDVFYGELDRRTARRLHRRYAELLAGRGAPTPAVATQFGLAAVPGDDEALSWLTRAARDTATTDSTAMGFLRQAVSLTPQSPERDALVSELAATLARLGDVSEAASLAQAVLTRDHDPALEPALRLVVGRQHLASGRMAAALAVFEAATTTADALRSNRGEALSTVVLGLLFSGDLAAADAAARRVLDIGEELGDDVVVIAALCTLGLLADCGGRIADAVALMRQAVARADASPGGHAHWFPIHVYLAYMLMDDDRLGEAERALRLGQHHAERLGAVANLPAYHFGHGVLGFLSGAWDTAIAEIGAGLLAAADIGSAFGVVWAQSVAALIAVHSDDLVGAAAALTGGEAHLHNEIQPFWHWSLWARAILSEAQGDLAGAAATMGTLVDGCIQAGSRYELVELAPDLIRTSLAVGDRQRALRATEAVEQVSGIAQRDNSTAAALRCRGLVAGKPELLVRASNIYVRAGRSISAAVTTSEAAELFAADGRKSDATGLLNEAIAVFEASGAYRHLARARVLAAGLGGPRTYTDVHRLTPAQRKVAELVTEGLTSAEIGRRLFISRRTVEGHLARIYTTLGVHSRVELALWLTDRL